MMLFIFLIYTFCKTEGINFAQFLILMFFFLNLVRFQSTLLVFEFPLGISETFLCCTLSLSFNLYFGQVCHCNKVTFLWFCLRKQFVTPKFQIIFHLYIMCPTKLRLFLRLLIVSCVPPLVLLLICVFMFSCFCFWSLGCWLSTAIN
jgi:hypothetical protein